MEIKGRAAPSPSPSLAALWICSLRESLLLLTPRTFPHLESFFALRHLTSRVPPPLIFLPTTVLKILTHHPPPRSASSPEHSNRIYSELCLAFASAEPLVPLHPLNFFPRTDFREAESQARLFPVDYWHHSFPLPLTGVSMEILRFRVPSIPFSSPPPKLPYPRPLLCEYFLAVFSPRRPFFFIFPAPHFPLRRGPVFFSSLLFSPSFFASGRSPQPPRIYALPSVCDFVHNLLVFSTNRCTQVLKGASLRCRASFIPSFGLSSMPPFLPCINFAIFPPVESRYLYFLLVTDFCTNLFSSPFSLLFVLSFFENHFCRRLSPKP